MKLGIAYNMFDGYELLDYVTTSSAKYTDFCCIVIQEVSNVGLTIDTKKMYEAIEKCGKKIDTVIMYTPNLKLSPMENEITKRNMGLNCCKDNGCTHGITSDVDEVYSAVEVEQAKLKIESEAYDSSACTMLEYYRDVNHIFKPNDVYYTSLIQKLDGRQLILATPWSISVDPTKKMKTTKLGIFPRNEIQQHHFSWIRTSIYNKFMNSSNKQKKTEENIKIVDEYYKNWKDGMPALLVGDTTFESELLKVNFDFLPPIIL